MDLFASESEDICAAVSYTHLDVYKRQLLRHLLIIFHRELTRKHVLKNEYLDHEMDTAASYFNENYNRDINIEEYATSRGMSVSWFIQNFKKFTGTTPMQFITSIRITNAQMLSLIHILLGTRCDHCIHVSLPRSLS